MSVCPMCKNNYTIIGEMRAVVEAAEDLVDAAAESDNENEIVAAASVLKTAISKYRNATKEGEHGIQ